MIKSYSIVIDEVDDAEIALEQLNAQMAKVKLLKNSAGIVSVHPEFIDSEVYRAVAKAFSFPLVGMTTVMQTTDGKTDVFLLSILVLTSDTCQFAYGESEAIPLQGGDTYGIAQKCYSKIRSQLESNVKIAFLFTPFTEYQGVHKYIQAISDTDKHVPVFGSVASAEMENILDKQRTVCCEHDFKDRLSILLISGDVSPEFYIGSVTKESVIIPNIGKVTAAKDNILTEINNINVNKFLEKFGFSGKDIRNQGTLTSVFIMDKKDKDGNVISSVSRTLMALSDGIAAFVGSIAVGSSISLAAITKEVVLTTAKNVVDKIKEKHNDKTILMFSCVGRRISLLGEPKKEYELLNEEFANSSFRYLALCSWGEICPTSVTETEAHNIEHNQSLVACVF